MAADTSHPSFPQPEDPDTPIWRYMSFDRFRGIVEAGRLYVPPAIDLSDPLEGSLPLGEVAFWEDNLSQAQTKEAVAAISYNRAFTGRAAKDWRDASFVSCWNLGRHESYTMWRAYAPQPDSVVIRSTYAKLRDALPNDVVLGRVRYVDYRSARFEDKNFMNYIMHKDVFYRHEDEVRAVLNAWLLIGKGKGEESTDLFQDSETGKRAYKPTIDFPGFIDGVVLHPEATETLANLVTAFCQANTLPRPTGSRALLRPQF